MPKLALARFAPATTPTGIAGEVEEALGYSKPRTYEELRALLSSATVRLPRQLRQVAIFITRNPSEFAVGNSVEISKKAGVQPSTLVRFAQTLGFPGFSELQEVFKEYVKINWTEKNGPADPVVAAALADDPDLRIIAGLIQASTASLSRLPSSIDLGMYAKMANLLAEAETVYLVGSKRAFPVTLYMALALSQLGIRNCLIDNVGSLGFEQLGFACSRDVVVAVNFSPYNSITPALAERASQSGASVVAMTDSAFSPLVPLAKAWIAVDEPDFGGFRSLAATIAIGMSLVLSVAQRRETR
jgi:DNA-binding MurR/RpiR family transcriptional regulator